MAMDQKRMMRIAQAAMAGDDNAAARILAEAAPLVRDRFESIDQRMTELEQSEWNREQTREAVLDGETEVSKEQTVAAMADVHERLLKLLALTPAALLAQTEEEAREIGEMWTETALELFVMTANPTYRYGLIGGVKEDRRAEVDDYFGRMGREVWGTVDVLSRTDEIAAADFPPETRAVLEAIIEDIDAGQQAPTRGD